MKNITTVRTMSGLLADLRKIIRNARYTIFSSVNVEMLKAYYGIGMRIVQEEQGGKARAQYGKNLIENVSGELSKEFGKGFDTSNLRRMRRFYLTFEKWETVSPKLSWSHYCELIKIEPADKRSYFQKYAEMEQEIRKLL